MLCHCTGGAISGCDVFFDNSSDGYSCKHAAVYWKYQLYTINLSTLSPSYDLFLRPMVFRIDEINICVFSFCWLGLVDIYCGRKPNFRITKRLCVPNHHLPILHSIHEINFLQNMFFIYVRQLFNTHICKYANI